MPFRILTKQQALIIGLAGALLLTGCSTIPSGGVSDADSVGERVEDRYNSIDWYTATVTKTVQTPTETRSVRATLTVDTAEQMRVKYHTGSQAGTATTVDLSGESSEKPTLSTGLQAATDEQIVSYGALATTLLRTNNVSFERTTNRNGHQTAVISVVPTTTENETANVERRIWVDTERLIPLQIETTWTTSSGQTVTETLQYTNVTIREKNSTRDTATSNDAMTQGGRVA